MPADNSGDGKSFHLTLELIPFPERFLLNGAGSLILKTHGIMTFAVLSLIYIFERNCTNYWTWYSLGMVSFDSVKLEYSTPIWRSQMEPSRICNFIVDIKAHLQFSTSKDLAALSFTLIKKSKFSRKFHFLFKSPQKCVVYALV